LKNIRTNLAAPGNFLLVTAQVSQLLGLLAFIKIGQARAQYLHGPVTVGVL
jgi:hypothetical protein